MKKQPKYRLRVKSLEFISAVGKPAQPTATARLIKSADGDAVAATFKVAKVDDEIGVVLGWALTSKVGGEDFYDLQGDTVDEGDLIRAAAEYAMKGGPVDEQHDEVPDAGQCIFLFPLTSEVAAALGIQTDTTGLLAGIKVAPDVLDKFKSGELTGFSIAGSGQREQLDDGDGDEPQVAKSDDGRTPAERAVRVAVEAYQRKHKIATYAQAFAKATEADLATREAYEAVAAERRAASERHLTSAAPSASEGSIVKAARVALRKAEADLEARVQKYMRQEGIESYALGLAQSTHADPEVRDAYERLREAREAVKYAPVDAAVAKYTGELSKLHDDIARQTEGFAVAHNMTMHEARERLETISPTFAKMVERANELGHLRDRAASAARARVEGQV